MNKLALALTIGTFSAAYAQSGATAKPAASGTAAKPAAGTPSGGTAAPAAGEMMAPPKPGPEQDALKPFAKGGAMTGTHMMPDGKEMPTKGKATCKWIDGNMWVACDLEETTGTGKTAMKWNGHWVFGYDNVAKAYRGYMVDNMGMSGRMKGTLDGTKMVWESMDEMKGPPGMPTKQRVTEDVSDPKVDKMTFEGMMNGKWVPMGSSTIKMAGGK